MSEKKPEYSCRKRLLILGSVLVTVLTILFLFGDLPLTNNDLLMRDAEFKSVTIDGSLMTVEHLETLLETRERGNAYHEEGIMNVWNDLYDDMKKFRKQLNVQLDRLKFSNESDDVRYQTLEYLKIALNNAKK